MLHGLAIRPCNPGTIKCTDLAKGLACPSTICGMEHAWVRIRVESITPEENFVKTDLNQANYGIRHLYSFSNWEYFYIQSKLVFLHTEIWI